MQLYKKGKKRNKTNPKAYNVHCVKMKNIVEYNLKYCLYFNFSSSGHLDILFWNYCRSSTAEAASALLWRGFQEI